MYGIAYVKVLYVFHRGGHYVLWLVCLVYYLFWHAFWLLLRFRFAFSISIHLQVACFENGFEIPFYFLLTFLSLIGICRIQSYLPCFVHKHTLIHYPLNAYFSSTLHLHQCAWMLNPTPPPSCTWLCTFAFNLYLWGGSSTGRRAWIGFWLISQKSLS